MTKFLNEGMRTLGSGSKTDAEAKATELTDIELDQVAGGLKMSDPRTSGGNNLIIYDDLSKAQGYTHTGDDLWVTGVTTTDMGSGR
jgi:hypothetical protein